jgi:hypothetical protein
LRVEKRITAIFPAGEGGDGETVAVFTELFDDGGVGDTVLDHEIDFVADGFWKTGDVPVTAGVGMRSAGCGVRSGGA